MKIAFIDPCGLCYDGNTLSKRGLGGSESAVILCSRELAKLGFEVTVFNSCNHDDAEPGYYDGVWYRPLQEIETTTDSYDVLIGSRSVAIFAPASIRAQFESFTNLVDFSNIQQRSNHKVLWMHDTFNGGDDLIEQLLLDGFINEVFTLSDWHTIYVSTCDHGKRRTFEVMKKYIFVTRNGISKYRDWVDVDKKDPNHFVYNSSVIKGMRPLVNKVWPRIRELIPDAKLTIIGGYYRMSSGAALDQQELEWRDMVARNPDINFTGVIKQSEIADILCDASYMIYPADFPETFGISTLESLYYNTPVITCYFGALEETAFDAACYKMPYCVLPNNLYPNIDQDEQVERFVRLTMEAYNNKYIHQQKMLACNAVKDICGWDSVALQWKQHLFYKLGESMPVDEYRKVQEINYKVRKTFGRRIINEEELQPPWHHEQTKTANEIISTKPEALARQYDIGETMKKILIAIPTNKYIEPETFKSIYDLEVPEGYETHFQFFYGYQIDQIRNLIAEWGKEFDYLFSVDSDIILPKDSLVKMLAWDKDIISGVYVQRSPGIHTPEIYHDNEYGGVSNTPWEDIKHNNGLCEIAGCGFGCVLVKSEVLREMEYPHFLYSSAIDHSKSLSEDIYFCFKARRMGYKIWCDTTIQCDHVGALIFKVEDKRLTVTLNDENAGAEPVEPVMVSPKQAIVIRTHDDALSYAYADLADQSCRSVGLEPVKWYGFNKNKHDSKTLFETLGVKFSEMDNGDMCASASHFGAWKHIASLSTNEPIVILEHDALMLHSIPEMSTADLDDKIIALGYKIVNPHEYDYKTAGAPEHVIPCERHSGSHAYMITPKTAKRLVKELMIKGSPLDIDHFYFMRTKRAENIATSTPLALMVPTPAIGWIRKSTLRDTPSTLNYDVHESFSKNRHQ